jgi:transcriptional regulator with XRE-family HTH domain
MKSKTGKITTGGGQRRMEIGNKINQLRKLSGMTQEQLAEKLNVSRQSVSKWENGGAAPDLESVVKISRLFQVSLDDLLTEGEEGVTKENDGQITLADLVEINRHNRKMLLLLISGLIFIMVSVLNYAYINALQNTTISTQYMLYRYIATGEYAYAPVDYMWLMIPSIVAGVIGVVLCLCYIIKSRKKRSK